MKEFGRVHRPMLIIQLDSKINGVVVDEVCKKLGKSHWSPSEAKGFSEGIWLLWDEEEIKIKILYAHNFLMHVAVTSADCKNLELTSVYAIPNASIRKHLLGKLNEMRIEDSLVIICDFKCVLKGEERNSSGGASSIFAN